MKIKEYLDKHRLTRIEFAKICGITQTLISRSMLYGGDIMLSTAIKIENGSNGEITCKDLYNELVTEPHNYLPKSIRRPNIKKVNNEA